MQTKTSLEEERQPTSSIVIPTVIGLEESNGKTGTSPHNSS
ncbi:MAG: hypothetical protein U5K51_00175 [Flavobacteriaceae bacterium]|nr:hypothetical protein [Flavobacteriaceae bacterium]